MQVSFNPTVSNKSQSNSKSQNPTFGAINEKLLTTIKGNINAAKLDLCDSLICSEISKTDAVDTLNAAKTHYFPKFQEHFDRLIKWAQNYSKG